MYADPLRFGGFSIWLLAFAALAAVIGWETGWGRRVIRAPELGAAPSPQPVSLALLPDYTIEGGVAARRETVERPAFVPTRRPAAAPVQEVPKPKMPRGQFTLSGTAVVDKNQIAFLREASGGRARTVRAGETINGMVVSQIKPDRVTLTLGDESEELVLKLASGPRQTIQPAQPAQAPQSTPTPLPGSALPPRPQPGSQPVAGAPPAPVDSDATILDRRRAARAAQAAQDAAAAAAAAHQAQRAAPPQAVAPAEQPPAAADPAWAEVYRRMQQRR